MIRRAIRFLVAAAGLALLAAWWFAGRGDSVPDGRREVIFWHFWGGKDRPVVEEIVRRFNESQSEHFVRAVAMPGNNLDMKFLLSVTGGSPPDLINQDDPVVADWAARGAVLPIDEVASAGEAASLGEWLFPSAREIGTYQGRLYAVCNGLDIRALYYDQDLLDSLGADPPQTLDELDALALRITPPDLADAARRFGYLPDPRRIWAWGIVFGGRFFDEQTGEPTVDDERIVAALEWMQSYSRLYGADQVAAFRKGDQALAGSSFPLLEGRYGLIMDGQWRVAEIAAEQEAARREGRSVPRYGVVPLPTPAGGRERAGWVNGNFFLVPRGAQNREGAWAFIKFWCGFGGNERHAARACAAGGWIPASANVVKQPEFEQFLEARPMFATFVELAASENQVPTPVVPGGPFFQAEVIAAAEETMYRGRDPRDALGAAQRRIAERLKELSRERP